MFLYQALYRTWRPRTFDDVVGQGHITETLKRQAALGQLSHAYLFTGTRGTGKTSCAKILARAVNCEAPVDGNPCNRCPSCVGIENGSILDVLELDAASNNGVDQVRALRDEAVYTPAAVKKRVYIIDEVHMLSTAAFNALLKILEEPPAHLMFILATTEIHKVPATIKSRCQQFSFKRILPGEIAGRLAHVAGEEGIALTADGADLLARLADGGLRDALSLLDQCISPDRQVGQEEILSALGLAGTLETAALMEHIAQRDCAAALSCFARLYGGGKDVAALMGELSALARDLLIRKTAPQGGAALLTGGYDEGTLRRLSERLPPARLAQILSRLQAVAAELPRSGNRRTDAELCLICLCDETLDSSAAGLTARVEALEREGVRAPAAAPAAPVPMSGGQPDQPPAPAGKREADDEPPPPWVEETAPTPWDEEPPEGAAPPPPPKAEKPVAPQGAAKPSTPPKVAGSASKGTAAGAPAVFWEQLLDELKGKLPRASVPFLTSRDFVTATYEDGQLTLWAESPMVKERVGRPQVLALLEAAAGERMGCAVRAHVEVGKFDRKAQKGPEAAASAHDPLAGLLAAGEKFGTLKIEE